jgi:hypothetical protein
MAMQTRTAAGAERCTPSVRPPPLPTRARGCSQAVCLLCTDRTCERYLRGERSPSSLGIGLRARSQKRFACPRVGLEHRASEVSRHRITAAEHSAQIPARLCPRPHHCTLHSHPANRRAHESKSPEERRSDSPVSESRGGPSSMTVRCTIACFCHTTREGTDRGLEGPRALREGHEIDRPWLSAPSD